MSDSIDFHDVHSLSSVHGPFSVVQEVAPAVNGGACVRLHMCEIQCPSIYRAQRGRAYVSKHACRFRNPRQGIGLSLVTTEKIFQNSTCFWCVTEVTKFVSWISGLLVLVLLSDVCGDSGGFLANFRVLGVCGELVQDRQRTLVAQRRNRL